MERSVTATFKKTDITNSDETVRLVKNGKSLYTEERDVEFHPSATLRRGLTFKNCFAFVVGALVGSGVFISPSLVASRTPNAFVALFVWLLSGLLSLIGSLCYCELVSVVQKTGSTYIFVYEAYGKFTGFFLLWTVVIVLLPCVSNVMILIIGSYACNPFFEDETSDEFIWTSRIVGLAVFYVTTAISCFGVQKSGFIQIVCNTFQMIIVALLTILGIYNLANTNDFNNFKPEVFFANSISGVMNDLPSFGTALFNALYCFDGWYMIAFFVEEIVNPKKNIPKLAATSLPFVAFVYIVVNLACLTTLSHEEMASSVVVFSRMFEKIGGKKFSYIVPFFVVISTSSALLGFLYQNSRFIMSAAREGQFPVVFSLIHAEKQTPIPATLFIAVAGTVVTLIGAQLETLIQFYNVAIWIEYGLAFSTVLYFRYKLPDVKRSYRVWITTPIFMLCVSICLIAMVFVDIPQSAIAFAIVFLTSIPVYYICLKRDWMSFLKLDLICKWIVERTNFVYCDVNEE